MTEAAIPGSLRREFQRRLETELFHRLADQKRQRRERKEAADNETDDLLEAAAVVLTDAEVAAFGAELDAYDEATVLALQENSVVLETARERMQSLLSQAHVLSDGRRVFKTEDGLRVFDEHGTEVGSSVIEPDEISDVRPTWETYRPAMENVARLVEERRAILDYQERLDLARERLDASDMTREELDELRDGLRAEMPDAVRAHVDLDADEPGRGPKVEAEDAAGDRLVISDDMVPTGMMPPRL